MSRIRQHVGPNSMGTLGRTEINGKPNDETCIDCTHRGICNYLHFLQTNIRRATNMDITMHGIVFECPHYEEEKNE